MDKVYLNMIERYFSTLESTGQADQDLKDLLFINIAFANISQKHDIALNNEQLNCINHYSECLLQTPCFEDYSLEGYDINATYSYTESTGSVCKRSIPSCKKNCETLLEVEYADLKGLIYNNRLIPGCLYRITDFVTMTCRSGYFKSQEEPFDIIVVALSKNTISEKAWAIKHTNGSDYFNNSNLSAWEIRYKLENDQNYNWAPRDVNIIDSVTTSVCTLYTESNKENTNITFTQKARSSENQEIRTIAELYEQYMASEQGIDCTVLISSVPVYMKSVNNVITQTSLVCWNDTNQTITGIYTTDIESDKNLWSGPCYYNINSNNFEVNGGDASYRATYNPGKGIITYMKDEYGNEAYYDFKNIQFKRYLTHDTREISGIYTIGFNGYYELQVDGNLAYIAYFIESDLSDYIWAFTFNNVVDNTDASLGLYCKNNIIGQCTEEDSETYILPNNVFFCGSTQIAGVKSNKLNGNCTNNTFLLGAQDNILDNWFVENLVGAYFCANIVATDVYNNVIADYFLENSIESGVTRCTILSAEEDSKIRFTSFFSGLTNFDIEVPYSFQKQAVARHLNTYEVRTIQTFEGADIRASIGSWVPIANIGDQDKFLKGDGSWGTMPAQSFVFTQVSASDTWIIEHNLGKKPSINVVDVNDNSIMGFTYTYFNDDSLVINFNLAISGKAYLN